MYANKAKAAFEISVEKEIQFCFFLIRICSISGKECFLQSAGRQNVIVLRNENKKKTARLVYSGSFWD